MITIHCGLHKTGSSSIQLALSQLDQPRGVPIIVPTGGLDDSTSTWASRFSSLRSNDGAVMSDENVLGSPLTGYSDAPERIAVLRRSLKGTDYRLVLYVRPQTDWLPSVYLQGVQEGRFIDPGSFWSECSQAPFLRWTNLVELLEREGGAVEVAVRAYAPRRDVVADFFAVAGLRLSRALARATPRENVSITASQAPLLALVGDLPGVTVAEQKALRSVFQSILRAGAAEGSSPFTSDIQTSISTTFHPDWEFLAQRAATQPGADADAITAVLREWRTDPRPYAGNSIHDGPVQAEALRSIRVLAGALDTVHPTTARRVLNQVRRDPFGLPSATLRELRRRRRRPH